MHYVYTTIAVLLALQAHSIIVTCVNRYLIRRQRERRLREFFEDYTEAHQDVSWRGLN